MLKTPVNISFQKYLSKLIFTLLLIVFAVLTFVGLYLINSFFTVKEIIVDNIEKNAISGIYVLKNKNIFLINKKNIIDLLVFKNPQIKDIELELKYPSTIHLKVELYEKIASLNVGNGYFILSEDGRILIKNKKYLYEVPTINYYQKLDYFSYNAGDFLNINDVNEGLILINYLKNIGQKIDNLDIKDKDMLLFNIEEKNIKFTVEKSIDDQKFQLEQVLRKLKEQGQSFQEIDLRFDKPIIKF